MKKFCALTTAIALLFLISPLYSSAQFGYGGFSRSHQDHAAMMNLLQYLKAKDEGKNLRAWWKGESTIGVAMAGPITYQHRLRYTTSGYFDVASGTRLPDKTFDTTMRGTLAPKVGFTVNGNSNHVLARLSENSILSFSAGMQMDLTRHEKLPSFNLSDNGKNDTSSTSMGYFQIGAPLTIDYKWGCDVDFNPDLKLCFAVGGGLMPVAGIINDHRGDGIVTFRTPPYVYASAGFYLLGCWKLRASYVPGAFVDNTATEGSNPNRLSQTSTIKGSNVITLGLAYMAFSRDWRDGRGDRGPGIGGGGKGGGSSSNSRRSRRHGGTMRMF